MANMREIKMRIKSIKETKQITKAMKLISAAKLKKARQQLEQTLPYFNRVKYIITDILTHSANIENVFFDLRSERESRKKAYFIITGDKGLAGGYNHNIIKLAEKHLKENPDSLVFVAGHVGRSYFLKSNKNVVSDFDYSVSDPTVYRAREISEVLLDYFRRGEVDEVNIVYTRMVSSIKLEPEVMKLLPMDLNELREDLKSSANEKQNDKAGPHIDENLQYEPTPKAVFDILIPKYVKGIIYGALVEAFTSEQSARMTAMDNATSNADEMLQKLNLFYNRARQSAITQEISEIVGGAAALQ